MRKISDLLGKPLLCLCEGTIEGTIKNITFDKKLRRPRFLVISDENDEGEFSLAMTSVFRIGADAVVIKSKNELLPAEDTDSQPSPVNRQIYTAFGECLGSVRDVVLHESKNEVMYLETSQGEILIERVFSFGNTVIILEDGENLRVTPPKPAKPRRKAVSKPAVLQTPPAPIPLIEEWTPPKPEGQKKLIGDYNFLLGRKTNDDIYDKQNQRIIKKNTLITRETVEKARAAGKLIDLTMRSLPEQYIY